jgi:hypothetical protein
MGVELSVRVDTSEKIGCLDVVAVENECVRVSILPNLGAKIYDIIDKDSGREVLWHNPRIRPQRVPFGSRFDDVWSGGWDEIFPNDAESVVNGEHFPDMGEIWPLVWECKVIQRKSWAAVTTSIRTPITPAEVKRTLTMRKGQRGFSVDYEIANIGRNPIDFLWKVHPAFEINRTCRIEIDAASGTVDRRYSHLFQGEMYRWPVAIGRDGKVIDISVVDPEANTCTLHYVTGLRRGKVAYIDEANGLKMTLTFPRRIMNNVWLFLAYGGWRGHYTAVIEPSTSYPSDLAEAIERGHSSRLRGGEKLRAAIGFELESLRDFQGGKRTKTLESGPQR